jgi:hypothetical protein
MVRLAVFFLGKAPYIILSRLILVVGSYFALRSLNLLSLNTNDLIIPKIRDFFNFLSAYANLGLHHLGAFVYKIKYYLVFAFVFVWEIVIGCLSHWKLIAVDKWESISPSNQIIAFTKTSSTPTRCGVEFNKMPQTLLSLF